MQWTQAKLQEQSDEQRDSRKANSSEYMISIKKKLGELKNRINKFADRSL